MATELFRRAERFHQVGIVVADLQKAMSSMSAALGCQEDGWTVFAAAEPFEHAVGLGAAGDRRQPRRLHHRDPVGRLSEDV